MRLVWGHGSEKRNRKENQDHLGIYSLGDRLLAVVCDGMGGTNGGAHASALAVKTIKETLEPATDLSPDEALLLAFGAANEAIFTDSRKHPKLAGMGTTAVAVIIEGNQAWVAHVGDSRAYLVRESIVTALTRDHTMVNMFVDAELISKEEADSHPEAHVLSRSLGTEPTVDVDVRSPLALKTGDTIMLCTDGVHGVVRDEELSKVDWTDPQRGVEKVLLLVNVGRGDDNATTLAITAQATGAFRASDKRKSQPSDGDKPSVTTTSVPFPLGEPTGSERATSRTGRGVGAATPVGSNSLVLGGLAGFLAAAGILLTAGVLLRNNDDPETTVTQQSQTAEPGGIEARVTLEGPTARVTEAPTAVTGQRNEEVFSPRLLPGPVRNPPRPKTFTRTPPGGSITITAVRAARQGRCGESLSLVLTGMEISPDHAKLFDDPWQCFDASHREPLSVGSARSIEELDPLLGHLEGGGINAPNPPRGPDINGDNQPDLLPDDDPVMRRFAVRPVWTGTPEGGLESLMFAWLASTDKDQMRKVLDDRQGAGQVSDALGTDLYLESEAARALSRLGPLEGERLEQWARRIYVIEAALDSDLAARLEVARPDLLEATRQRLTEATAKYRPAPNLDLSDPEVEIPAPTRALILARAFARDEPIPEAWLPPVEPEEPQRPVIRRTEPEPEPEPEEPIEPQIFRAPTRSGG